MNPWRCECTDPRCVHAREVTEAWDLLVATFAAEAAPLRPTETVRVKGDVL